jgi:hypothetical protein
MLKRNDFAIHIGNLIRVAFSILSFEDYLLPGEVAFSKSLNNYMYVLRKNSVTQK